MRLQRRSRSIALVLSVVGAVGLAAVGFTALRSEQLEPEVPADGAFEYSHCLSVDGWQDRWRLLTVVRHVGPADEVTSVEEVAVEIPDDAAVESVEVRVFEGPPFMTAVAEDDSASERTSVIQGMSLPAVDWNSLPVNVDDDVEYTVAVVSEFPADGELNPEEPLFRATSITYRDGDGEKMSEVVDVEQWISRASFDSDEYCATWSQEATG